jgi:DUF1680 family protein
VKNIYFRAHDGVAVNLYAPSRLQWSENGTAVTLAQETDYPLRGTVTLRVTSAAPIEFTLRMRVPSWLNAMPQLQVNGKPVHADEQQGFAVVRRRWVSGDALTFELPLEFRTEAIDDLHPETVALLRGPLVYVEQNPADVESAQANPEALRPASEAPGVFSSHTGNRSRTYAPFYFVRDEAYTMYAQHG